MSNSNYPTFTVIRRLVMEARGYWLQLAGVLGLSLLATPLLLLNPVPVKIVVDNVVGTDPLPGYIANVLPSFAKGSDMALLITAVSLMLAIEILKRSRNLATQYLRTFTAQHMVLDFRTKLFAHAQRLSLGYHDRAGSMDSTYRILHDAGSINQILLGAGLPLVQAWFPLFGIVVVMAALDLTLTLIALLVVPVLVVLIRLFGWRLRRKWKEVKDLDSSATSMVQETLSTLRVVKAFAREESEQKRFVDESSERVRGHLSATLTSGTYFFLVGISITAATTAVLFVGTLHVKSGILTLGELLMIMSYIGQIFQPLNRLSAAAEGLTNGLAGAERALQLLDQTPEVTDHPGARRLDRARGAVEFRSVSFSYDDDVPVVRDVSFRVEPGARVAITGRTGAGKSTLVSLLMRFYEVDSGQVLVDGRPITDFRLADYRRQFAIVLQDPVLFSASIAENIRYGKSDATQDQVVKAARQANAHDFIASLEQGYDTQVGERGTMLSGGERQRISCARAFLKDAPILILDEPTSSVDSDTEAEILEAFDRLQQGRTTFVISHRPTTLTGCTQRLHLENGSVIVTPIRVQMSAAMMSAEPADSN